MLLCFIKPILGNCYVLSRDFIVSEPRETQPRSEIANVPTLPCPPLIPGVSGSSPSTLTTSLATPVPSSSSSNGPSNYYVDNQGLVSWRLHRLGRSKVRSASLVNTRAPSLSYFHYGNVTGMIASGQFVTSLDTHLGV